MSYLQISIISNKSAIILIQFKLEEEKKKRSRWLILIFSVLLLGPSYTYKINDLNASIGPLLY